jgi:hypothetical protein
MDIDATPKEKIASTLYEFISNSYKNSLTKIELVRQQRLEILKHGLISLTIRECQALMSEWEDADSNFLVLESNFMNNDYRRKEREETGIEITLNEISDDHVKYKRIETIIPNQFQSYWKDQNSCKSCLAISVVFAYLFHLAKTKYNRDKDYIDDQFIGQTMERGIQLYNIWFAKQREPDNLTHLRNKIEKDILTPSKVEDILNYPLVTDILNLKECEGFKESLILRKEIAGICVINNRDYELENKSDSKPTLRLLFENVFQIFKDCQIIKCIPVIINCCGNYSFTVGFHKEENNKKIMMYLFDSHGYDKSKNITVDFISSEYPQTIIDYILKKFSIKEINDRKDHQSKSTFMSDEEIISKYTYCATIFY